MPKKGKKNKHESENEGRPADLTFGSFLAAKLEAATSSKPATLSPVPQPQIEDRSEPTVLPSVSEIESVQELNNDISSKSVDTEPGYSVRRTKKGNLPLSYENRNKGKKVTVISNVTGDAKILLSELKHKAGCGGVIKGETIELQGDRRDLVTKFLKGHSCLK